MPNHTLRYKTLPFNIPQCTMQIEYHIFSPRTSTNQTTRSRRRWSRRFGRHEAIPLAPMHCNGKHHLINIIIAILSQFSDVRIGKHQVIEKLSIMEIRNPVMLILQDRRRFLPNALACNQRFVGCDDIFRGNCPNISISTLCHVSQSVHTYFVA